ncbi:hypothetical protein ACWEO4_46765, partial [Streptomyces sp. NPDC004393]
MPDNAAYRQILAVFAETDGLLRARHVCEAMDLEIMPNNVTSRGAIVLGAGWPEGSGRGDQQAVGRASRTRT